MAQLYCITHLPTNLKYYGTTWGKNKTYTDRFNEHMQHRGSKYISQMIRDGASTHEFTVTLLEEGPTDLMCNKEMILAKDNLYPNGLNGNAGKNIVRTSEGQVAVSSAVSKAKKGKTKNTSTGVARQAEKLSAMRGENRTEKQKAYDKLKPQIAKEKNISPPSLQRGSKKMTNGKVNTFVSPDLISVYLDNGWVLGSCKKRYLSQSTKDKLKKPKPKIKCPHCQKEGGLPQMKRFHYDNCKLK